jgi:DoxX-like family
MNILLWVLQVALALFCLAGGAYKIFQYEELAKVPAAASLSRGGWGAIGVFEMSCAVLLVVPAAAKWMPVLTLLAAAALALESLVLGVLFARYSLKLTAANPLVWVVGMGLAAAFVGYGRYALRPIA